MFWRSNKNPNLGNAVKVMCLGVRSIGRDIADRQNKCQEMQFDRNVWQNAYLLSSGVALTGDDSWGMVGNHMQGV